ncbi:MAG: glycosyltransferase family 2 protein [Deltaproteobacteria bacterium]|nr:MAG: glycosyltransferase family 2 protein [Deltaproteobacteria bacterium]
MINSPLISIIIVNWNAGQQLSGCLESIANANLDGFNLERVVVVDNASTDGSLKGIVDLSLPLTIINNTENCGFAAACNQGAKDSQSDYLLFLNPDTRLFKDSLIKPLAFMEQPENQKIGITGIQLVDEDGQISRTCARFPTPAMFFSKMLGLNILFPRQFPSHFMSEWDHGETRDVEQVMGAFFLIRRHLFEALNGFDEQFFVYFEEVDLSYRANNAGWKTVYLADARAYHKGGGTSEQVKATRMFYSLRSRILYGYKHFDWFSATLLMAGTLFVEPISRLALAIWKRSGREAKETIKGYVMLWCALPKLFRSTLGGESQ